MIGQELRDKCHQLGLWHQRATVFVFNNQGELLIQKRAPNMNHPNLWCGSASGHVLAGETFEQGARRELQEELGISTDFQAVGEFKEETTYASGDIDQEWHKLFVCHFDGPFNFQKEEISEIKFLAIDEIQQMLQKNSEQFLPGFRQELDYYLKKR